VNPSIYKSKNTVENLRDFKILSPIRAKRAERRTPRSLSLRHRQQVVGDTSLVRGRLYTQQLYRRYMI